MTDRTILDQFIIEANALDVLARSDDATPESALRAASQVWDTMTSQEDKDSIRKTYAPAYYRLSAAVLNRTADLIAVTDDGSVIDTYRTEFADELRSRAATHLTLSEGH